MVDQAEIHRMAQSKSVDERRKAADELGSNFAVLPDKEQAWSDLHRLTEDENKYVRMVAVDSLGVAFPHIPEEHRVQAWSELVRLAQDRHRYMLLQASMRWVAVDSLGVAFPHIPENYRERAWCDLHRLTEDENKYVRASVANSLGVAFPHIPEMHWRVLSDLNSLSQDYNTYVRAVANHSLGRVSIFKATEAENYKEFKKKLEEALEYFESSLKEATYYTPVRYNPSRFCFYFYLSFYAITFRKQEAEYKVKNCLAEAKSAVEGSESKEKLLEVIENLTNALKDAQKAKDFNGMKCDLNSIRRYCDRAVEILETTEDKAPVATKLIRIGGSIIDEKIKEILAEIQQRANTACKQAKGTPTEELTCNINQEVQKWQISDQEQMRQNVDNLIFILRTKIPDNQANKHICDKIQGLNKETDLVKQYQLIVILIALIPQTVIEGIMTNEYVVGDKIVANHSSIVHKSSFSTAINTIKESGNYEIAKAIKDLANLIENSNFENRKETIENIESLAEEAAKQNPRKGTMRVLGASILNSVQKISEIVEKVSPLMNIISKLWL